MIDTPGIIDTESVKAVTGTGKYRYAFSENQKAILRELARMFVLAPEGFNAFLLTVKIGARFTPEDCEALQMLKSFLGEEALDYMILLLTHGDDAEYEAGEAQLSVDEYVDQWVDSMETWVKEFIRDTLKNRKVLINGRVDPNKKPEAYKKQLSKLIEVIRVN